MLTNVSSETHYHSDERSFPLLPKVEPPEAQEGVSCFSRILQENKKD